MPLTSFKIFNTAVISYGLCKIIQKMFTQDYGQQSC